MPPRPTPPATLPLDLLTIAQILDDRRTQMRFPLTPAPPETMADGNCINPRKHPGPYFDAYRGGPNSTTNGACWWTADDRLAGPVWDSPAKVGDTLVVLEPHFRVRLVHWPDLPHRVNPKNREDVVFFKHGFDRSYPAILRPSTNLPRWASRLSLTVTDVRLQRLQDITEEDALREGVGDRLTEEKSLPKRLQLALRSVLSRTKGRRKAAFGLLWNEKYGVGAFEENPWVFALTFEVAGSRGAVAERVDKSAKAYPPSSTPEAAHAGRSALGDRIARELEPIAKLDLLGAAMGMSRVLAAPALAPEREDDPSEARACLRSVQQPHRAIAERLLALGELLLHAEQRLSGKGAGRFALARGIELALTEVRDRMVSTSSRMPPGTTP